GAACLTCPVFPQSDLKIDPAGGGSNLPFTAGDVSTVPTTGRIDSQGLNEHNDLKLNAGTGSVFFNGNIGGGQTLQTLVVDTAAGGVTFGGADAATIGASGPVTTVHTEGLIDIGSGFTAAGVIGGRGVVVKARPGGKCPLVLATHPAPRRPPATSPGL